MGGFNVFHLIVWYFAFVVSATVHEAAHALAALKLGDPTAHRGGQVTLNPRPHMKREPWGMIYVPIISFMLNGWILGWASTPFSPDWAWRYPKRSALMSLAGPLANLFLFALSFLLIRVGLSRGVFEQAGPFSRLIVDGAGVWHPVAMVLGVFFLLNLILFVLNLIPAPPMDGSSVIMLFMPDNTARQWMVFKNQGMFMLVTLIVLLYGFGRVFRPILGAALDLLFM